MNFIILADKYLKGMKSKGSLGLLPVNKKYNIIEFQYKNIKKHFPKAKIIYVYGFDHKKIELFFESKNYKDLVYVYNPDYEKYNYVNSLNCVKEYLNGNCFITFGDVLFRHQIFNKFANTFSQVFVNTKIKNKLGCTISDDNLVNNISFELDNYLSQLYYIHKSNIEIFKTLIGNETLKNYFLFEVINKMIDYNIGFAPFIHNNKNLIHQLNEIKTKI